MRGARALVRLTLLLLFTTSVGVAAAAPQASKGTSGAGASAQASSAALKVCLRMQDDSPFAGVANVRVASREGREATGAPTESDGETIFSDIPPGTYTVEASAPGFLAVRQETQIEPGNRLHTALSGHEAETVARHRDGTGGPRKSNVLDSSGHRRRLCRK